MYHSTAVSDCLVRNIHTSGLLEVVSLDPGGAHPVPPCTKEQMPILLKV